jgi:hypothetical protein
MDLTRSQSAVAGHKAAPAVLPQESAVRRMEPSAAPSPSVESVRKPAGYGLPCSKCHLYYSADLDICPTCHNKERVSPVMRKSPPVVASVTAETPSAPDDAVIEQEREEFLRQFKSQLFAAHAEVVNSPLSVCNMGENHSGVPANAEICKPCYERLQEQLDVCEGAFHMDLKEAAQIIYDAVWADPSDPSKTYQNAANALLSELRKRAGIATLLGPFQSLTH